MREQFEKNFCRNIVKDYYIDIEVFNTTYKRMSVCLELSTMAVMEEIAGVWGAECNHW